MDPRTEVATTLQRLSQAWQNRRYDELRELLDEHVVVALPASSRRMEGREGLVESFRDFMENASLERYHEEPANIDVWGETAVATYRWDMHWTANGKSEHESGHDVFVFARRRTGNPAWRAVWRTLIAERPG